MTIAAVASLLIGVCLLFFGRKLFWLVGAAIGFVAAVIAVQRYFPQSSDFLTLLLACVAGILGAFLAVFLQRVAIWAGGFLAGGFILMNLLERFGVESSPYPLVGFVGGGIIGAILVSVLFDWALIIISSLTGAFLIIHALDFAGSGATVLVLLLFGVGVLTQAKMKRGGKPGKEHRPAAETEKHENASGASG